MPLRLIDVLVPARELERIPSLLSDIDRLDLRTFDLGEGQGLVRVLAGHDQTEAITDALSRAFENVEGFRLILLEVEATLPAAEIESEPEPASTSEDSSERASEEAPEKAPERVSREELYQDVVEGARASRVYLVTVALSTVVAAVGLVRNDVAIVIGAMVIAPLLGPNVALSLASTLGDLPLAFRSLRTNAVGAGLALALSFLIGLLIRVDPTVPAIASRTEVGLSDVVLALASGAAGALAYTTGLPTAVVGVMVSVALLPPLVVGGLLLGAGRIALASEALLLVLTNVTCLNLAGVATFLLQRIRPRTWWENEKAKQATRIAITSWLAMLAVLVLVVLWKRELL